MKRKGPRHASGVPAEFMALEDDMGHVQEQLGPQELNVRTRLLEAYRVLAFPRGGGDRADLFSGTQRGRCWNASASISARPRNGGAGPAVGATGRGRWTAYRPGKGPQP